MLESREIETFLVLGQELHFGRAAQRLYVSQARVSQTIRALEHQVGGKLFDRTSRRVRMTPLGEEFRDHLWPAYERIRQALGAARDVAASVTGDLRVGTCSLAGYAPLDRVLDRFTARHPGCRVLVSETFALPALEDLRCGKLDLAALPLPVPRTSLVVGPVLSREDRVLLVKTGHPLTRRDEVTPEDLGDHAVPNLDGLLPAETRPVFTPTHTPGGRPITRRHTCGGVLQLLSLIAKGSVVQLSVPSFLESYHHPQVTAVPIQDMPKFTSALLWNSDRETAAVRAFAAQVASEMSLPKGQDQSPNP